MAIVKRPEKATEDKFIHGAPDAKTNIKANRSKGGKRQITLVLDEGLLAQFDEAADRYGLSRAAAVNIALRQFLETGLALKK